MWPSCLKPKVMVMVKATVLISPFNTGPTFQPMERHHPKTTSHRRIMEDMRTLATCPFRTTMLRTARQCTPIRKITDHTDRLFQASTTLARTVTKTRHRSSTKTRHRSANRISHNIKPIMETKTTLLMEPTASRTT